MNKLIIFLHLVWLPLKVTAQTPSFNIGNEENYAFEVKIIDEFIERFNGENTLLIKYIKEKKLPAKTDRPTLIKGLFDREASTPWNIGEVQQFIDQVTNTSHPVYLSFYDTSWFAEVNCKMLYKGKPQQATLLLKVKLEENKDSKWIIAGVKANFLPQGMPAYAYTPTSVKRSLNPVSHATDFMGLYKAFKDKANLHNYFSAKQMDAIGPFIQALEKGELEFVQVNNITYHFLQVKGWTFTVQQVNRQTRNSGWLISRLLKTDDSVKDTYEFSILK